MCFFLVYFVSTQPFACLPIMEEASVLFHSLLLTSN